MIKTVNVTMIIVSVSSVTLATSLMKTVSVSLQPLVINAKLIIASSTGMVTPKASGITTGLMGVAKSAKIVKKATTSIKISHVTNYLKTAKKSTKKGTVINVLTAMNSIGSETVSKLSLPPMIIIAKRTNT